MTKSGEGCTRGLMLRHWSSFFLGKMAQKSTKVKRIYQFVGKKCHFVVLHIKKVVLLQIEKNVNYVNCNML